MGICYNERKRVSKETNGGSSINNSGLDNHPGKLKDDVINPK